MPGRTYALKTVQMREAAALHAQGWSIAQLAERFNVSRNAVQNAFAYMGVRQRTPQQGRDAARVSGYHEWKRERRKDSAMSQAMNYWRAQ